MDKFRILVSCDLGKPALDRFASEPGVEVTLQEIKTEEALIKALPGHHALIVRSNVKVTAKALDAADLLTVVGRAGIGVDNIDMDHATRLGIAVVNAPSGNSVTTGEHALALLMGLARNIPRADRSMRRGEWEKKLFMGRELTGKTLGIIGVGKVGGVVASRAIGLKMKVVAHDPYLSPERAAELGVTPVSLPELLSRADLITLHTPLTAETRNLINRETLGLCKKGVLLVNCARGPLVDEDALYEAIVSGKVAGAALDVFAEEPPPPHPLYAREEVVTTPHLGASTFEAQESVALETAENVLSYLALGTAATLLNLPAVAGESLDALNPYLKLAHQLGRFLAQTLDGPVEKLTVAVQGEAAQNGAGLITAAAVKGVFSELLTERVNFVNALKVAGERGVQVTTAKAGESLDFVNLISLEASGPGSSHSAQGALFGKRKLKLVNFDGYRIDALPEGNLILIFNRDVPGVIGSVGECLGGLGINISAFYNGRAAIGGRAISLVNVDTPVEESHLKAIRALPNVESARRIFL